MHRLTTCCFTGHRPKDLFAYNSPAEVYARILKAVEDAVEDGYTDFLCGGCIGGDFLFADAVISVRSERPDREIRLNMCLPCRDQAEKWERGDRDRYSGYLQVADSIVCLSDRYTEGCMQKRNRYMVDRSSLLIAAYNGSSGGTEYTYKYARRSGLRTVNLLEIPTQESDQLSFL